VVGLSWRFAGVVRVVIKDLIDRFQPDSLTARRSTHVFAQPVLAIAAPLLTASSRPFHERLGCSAEVRLSHDACSLQLAKDHIERYGG
jgi:hypothetical protein